LTPIIQPKSTIKVQIAKLQSKNENVVSREGAEAQRTPTSRDASTDEKMEKGLQGVGVVVWFGE